MNLGSIKPFGIELSWDELLTWSIPQLVFVRVFGWWVIPIAVLCGLFGALGGSADGNKLFRRLGVPAIPAIALILIKDPISALVGFVLASASIWCIGYGKNAKAYKYFYNFSGNHEKADFQARTLLLICYLASWVIGLL